MYKNKCVIYSITCYFFFINAWTICLLIDYSVHDVIFLTLTIRSNYYVNLFSRIRLCSKGSNNHYINH